MKLTPAYPDYAVGEIVNYRDRQGRLQQGKVTRIEARWTPWGGAHPLVLYRLWHPTYARNNFNTTAGNILPRTPAGRSALSHTEGSAEK